MDNYLSQLRNLWLDFIIGLHSHTISKINKLGDVEVISDRLTRTTTAISDIYKKVFGDKVGTDLQSLLQQHTTAMIDYANSVIDGTVDKNSEQKEQRLNTVNAIADYLSSINPHYDKNIIQDFLNERMQLSENLLVKQMNKQYVEAINLFDMIILQVLRFAEYLANGLGEYLKTNLTSPDSQYNFVLRKLWHDHAMWILFYLKSKIVNGDDTETVMRKRLNNILDIGNILRYSNPNWAVDRFVSLMSENVVLGKEYTDSIIVRNANREKEVEALRRANNNNLAFFLGDLNKNYNESEIQKILDQKTNITFQLVDKYVNKKYAEAYAMYDNLVQNSYELADVMSKGITIQPSYD